MKVAFRTDASLQISSGHVMRCLTLADALKAHGAECHFISREHPGHLLDLIRQRGHLANSLPSPVQRVQAAIKNDDTQPVETIEALAHAAWLGCDWETDAAQTADILDTEQPDWLVVDHYALDHRWESALRPHYKKLMVVDDLADRSHNCDLLLDQNLGRQPQDYASLVPATCQVLTGPPYALLRPEFAALRDYSLKRRASPQGKQIKQLLITMGGVDLPNATGQVLEALKNCPLPADVLITVVMGAAAPWLKHVCELAEQMPWPTTVLVNITDMAQRMADSDLAIGAAGSTSWERCCMGLPTLVVVLADNQRDLASALDQAGAAIALELANHERFDLQLADAIAHLLGNRHALCNLGLASASVTEGVGTTLVAAQLLGNLTP